MTFILRRVHLNHVKVVAIIFSVILLCKLYLYRTDYMGKLHIDNTDTDVVEDAACIHPKLKLWPKEFEDIFGHVPSIQCSPLKEWVEVRNGTIYVNEDHINKGITCSYTELLRVNDHKTKYGNTITVKHTPKLRLFRMKRDYYAVACHNRVGEQYKSVLVGVHFDPELHKRKRRGLDDERPNVLMIGFDSLSRLTYIRKLTKTYKYFTEVLGGVVLDGYNIVGDGTPQALIPILTGYTELELPRTLKRIKGSPYCDVLPMVWKDFRKAGYVTAWAEDNPYIGTFTTRMTGFNNQPVDHYLRPFYVHFEDTNEKTKHAELCLGGERRSQLFLRWLKEVFVQYNKNIPVWVFGFHSELSHGHSNMVETADEDLVDMLSFLKNHAYLDNTIVILMSDHGARFSELREFVQGRQEERRPFMGLFLPKKFTEKYPKAYAHLKSNVKRLSTPFDMYPTFCDILKFSGNEVGDTNKRSISLFKEIPVNRTCGNAGIEPHWCACLNWEPSDINDKYTRGAVVALIDYMNELTSKYRKMCAQVHLDKLKSATKLVPKRALLDFRNSKDEDGYQPEMGAGTQANTALYQISIVTKPGNGHFEATIRYNLAEKAYFASECGISRTNKYGSDSSCIPESHSELRKFCYCLK